MPKLLNFFKRETKPFEKMIEDSSRIGKNVKLAPNVYIGHDVEIGDNVVIYPNVTICEGVKIGEGTIIYSNVSIREFCEIGKNKPFEKMIEDSSKIGKNVKLAPNVYIGHDVEIGDNVVIYPNVTICEGVKIGEGTIIYSNVSIREFCEIGKNCVLQPGCVIGSDGFGFIKINGNNTKIDQIGHVVIEDNVEIGANTTVDRGTIGNTVIKKYTKIDNLVQIAHNDIIGENCLLVSQVGIAGSVEVGNNTTLAGQTGVAGHLKIKNFYFFIFYIVVIT